MVDQIKLGREAWGRIKERHRVTWDDWLCVGRALVIGRIECMKEAGTNTPKGGRYNFIANRWFAEHGFADVCAQERSRIIKIIDNLEAVEAWRATLPMEEQRKINHPSLWFRFCASRDGQPKPRRYPPNPGPRLNSAHVTAMKPSQDLLRILASALHKNWTVDTYPLASAVLREMRAHREEFIEFLTAEPPPVRPRRVTAPAVLELSA